MDTISYRDRVIEVREIARPEGWLCRVLVGVEDDRPWLEYVVSVGPYKVDVLAYHPLAREDFEAFQAGRLDLGTLARNLAEHDQLEGTYERRD